MTKGNLSFADLSAQLKSIGYDATIKGIGKSPCASELHYIFEKIPKECFERGLRMLDELSAKLYSKFEEDLDVFVTDGTAISGVYLEEGTIKLKKRLVKERHDYTFLIRIHTNTIRCVKEHTNKIPFITMTPPNSTFLADPEFDVEENYRTADLYRINLHIKQKRVRSKRCRKPFRRKFGKKFDSEEYRKRKLGERCFGNIEVRGTKCYYRKEENKLKGVILIACHHNIIQYFKNKAWCNLFVNLR